MIIKQLLWLLLDKQSMLFLQLESLFGLGFSMEHVFYVETLIMPLLYLQASVGS